MVCNRLWKLWIAERWIAFDWWKSGFWCVRHIRNGFAMKAGEKEEAQQLARELNKEMDRERKNNEH